MIEFLNWDNFKLFDVDIPSESVPEFLFSVESGTIGSVSVTSVSLLSSEALIDPEDVSLKLDLKELNDIDPEVKSSVLLTVSDILEQL